MHRYPCPESYDRNLGSCWRAKISSTDRLPRDAFAYRVGSESAFLSILGGYNWGSFSFTCGVLSGQRRVFGWGVHLSCRPEWCVWSLPSLKWVSRGYRQSSRVVVPRAHLRLAVDQIGPRDGAHRKCSTSLSESAHPVAVITVAVDGFR